MLVFIHLTLMPFRYQLADSIRQSIDISLLSLFLIIFLLTILSTKPARRFSRTLRLAISFITLIGCRSSRNIYLLSFLWVKNFDRLSPSSSATMLVFSFNLAWDEN